MTFYFAERMQEAIMSLKNQGEIDYFRNPEVIGPISFDDDEAIFCFRIIAKSKDFCNLKGHYHILKIGYLAKKNPKIISKEDLAGTNK